MNGHACGSGLPTGGEFQGYAGLRCGLGAVGHGNVHFALHWFRADGDYGQRRGDAYGERGDNVHFHALVAVVQVLDIAELDGQVFGDLDVACFYMKDYAEWSGAEREAEGNVGVEAIDRRSGRVLPIVVIEIRSGQAGVLRDVHVGVAVVDGVLFDGCGLACAAVEPGKGRGGYAYFRNAAIHGEHGNFKRLAGDDQAVVGYGVEDESVGGDDCVLIIALLEIQTEVDFVAGRIAQAHGSEL